MSERLTDEELDVLRLNVSSLSFGEPCTPEYVGEFTRATIKKQVDSIIAELRYLRAQSLTAAEVEALDYARSVVSDSDIAAPGADGKRNRALAILDRLLARGGK